MAEFKRHSTPLLLLVSIYIKKNNYYQLSSSSQHYFKLIRLLFLPYSTKCLIREEEFSPTSSSSSSSSLCNSIIRTSIEKGSPQKALHHYQTILSSGNIQPDYQMISYVLDACKISSHYPHAVKSMHSRIFKSGFHSYPSLLISLISVYVAHNHIDYAHQVFQEIPNPGFSSIVSAANLIIAGYLRTGQFDFAKRFFQQMPMPHRDVVSWNTMITGCLKISRPKEAIGLFRRMLDSGFEPDGFTFASVLTACGRTGALSLGEWAHNLMIEKQTELNFILSSALVDMYSKCGRIKSAKEVFNSVQRDHISVWNSMIIGLAFHGLASEAIEMFSRLKSESVKPDSITFIGILTACNHCGMVEKGREFFDLMRSQYNIEPELEHYGAIVDLLGRAGLLEEAQAMIRTMPMEPDVVIWRSLLSACRIHGKPELGEIATERMVNLGSGDYVLLSNIYSSTKRWDRAERVRELMKKKGVRKGHGLSWVEFNGVIHQFKAGDHSHPESTAIYKVLDGLSKRLKFNGFMPAVELVLMDVTEEDKEGNLNCHSEKLAVAYGILKTSPGTEIRVSKNLRTCYDCHLWIKMVSKVLNRIIVMRDRVRFHRFENGYCSCRDYW